MVQTINSKFVEEENKILTTPCTPVLEMTQEYDNLIRDMVDTAKANPVCIGLAANQIWKDATRPAPTIMIMPGYPDWAVCINPAIEQVWKKEAKEAEGCMSVPRSPVSKKRARHIKISYYGDKLVKQKELHLFDLPARIFQHEVDHLKGILLHG